MHDDPPDAAPGDHTPDPKPDLAPGRAPRFDLLADWATIWQSELAALALDRELEEFRTALLAATCPAPAAAKPPAAGAADPPAAPAADPPGSAAIDE